MEVRNGCAGVCCCAERTAAAPGVGRPEFCGIEDAASSSMGKSSEVSSRCSVIWTIMLNRKTSKNSSLGPLPGAPNVGEEILRSGGGVHPP
jgi:hypothetical protein